MQPRGTAQSTHTFGEFEVDTFRGALRRNGVELKLRPKSFEVLRYLLENHGRLVTKDELFAAIWGGVIVTDGALTQCLIDVRRAIGDESRQIIRTVPRRGYIFELPVDGTATERPLGGTATERLPDGQDTVKAAGQPSRRVLAALLIVAVAGAAGWWVYEGRDEATGRPLPVETRTNARANVIAVLPFADMSADRDQEYFGDGVAEEILNLLTQIPELKVVARTSSFSFKDGNSDIATIADRLNASWILEGSVRRSGNLVRVTAQLVDASSIAHVWSRTYDRDIADILGVQTDIAKEVAAALQVTLSDAVAARAAGGDIAAYEHFLQGQFFFNRRGPGDTLRAEQHFLDALEIDAGFAKAWAGLAGSYFIRVVDENLDPQSGWPKMREAVERALEADASLPEAQIRAAQSFYYAGDYAAALRHQQRAFDSGARNPLVLGMSAGAEAFAGRLDGAIERQRQAVSLDPLSAVGHGNLGYYLLSAGRFDEAELEFETARALHPARQDSDFNLAVLMILQGRAGGALAKAEQWPQGAHRAQVLAFAWHALGRETEADAAMTELSTMPDADVTFRMAEVSAFRGNFEESFAWLERLRADAAAGPRASLDHSLLEIRLSPFLKPLHGDPQWQEIALDDR